jgi:hypothetical protein
MPYGSERLRPTQSAENEALFYAALPGAAGEIQLGETRVEPISVPRPQAFDTVTIGVVTGRPLKLDFPVTEVKTREVVRDDLILGFENGGKVVLKDYMHAFGLLGDQRTTIIQPDGKHYAFTELLAPTTSRKPDAPATRAAPDVVIIQKPAPGETERFKLSAEKPMALNFGMADIARTEVNKEGDLVVTFKDRAVLVLEGYAALKGSADIALYFAKGDKIALGDLAPGAGPEGDAAEGGHLFTQFAPGGSLGPLDHLGALGPEPFELIPPPGPPESPPGTPPKVPPPPDMPPLPVDCKPPPPKDCEPPPKDCAPPEKPIDCRLPPVCEPPPKECAPDLKDHAKDGGKDHGDGHGKLTWIVVAGIDAGGDVQGEGGRWGERGDGAHPRAEATHRGWIDGHDGPALHAQQMLAAFEHHASWARDDAGDGAGQMRAEHAPPVGKGDHDGGWSGDHGQWSAAPRGDPQEHGHGREGHGAPMSAGDVFDSGHGAPAQAGDHGGGHFAAPHDFAAVTAHAESHTPQIQNHAQHNVMGHG